MRVVALIPARYDSSRFPGKLLANLGGKPVILRTYEAVRETGLFEEVIVVTDHDEILNVISRANGKAIKSLKTHECGTDRIAEAVEFIDADIVLNVQGDEPFTNREALENLINVFRQDQHESVDVASLMQRLTDINQVRDSNFVKVVVNQQNDAIYFSRSPIPFPKNDSLDISYFEHIGVYAFRKNALLEFYNTDPTPLETTELIECLRHIEMGKTIRMVETNYMGIEIDTPEDLLNAEIFLNQS